MISVKGNAKVVALARTDPVFARVRAEASLNLAFAVIRACPEKVARLFRLGHAPTP